MTPKPMNTPTDGLESLIRLGLPMLDAEAANEQVVKLTCEVMRLQAIIDRAKMLHQANLGFGPLWPPVVWGQLAGLDGRPEGQSAG